MWPRPASCREAVSQAEGAACVLVSSAGATVPWHLPACGCESLGRRATEVAPRTVVHHGSRQQAREPHGRQHVQAAGSSRRGCAGQQVGQPLESAPSSGCRLRAAHAWRKLTPPAHVSALCAPNQAVLVAPRLPRCHPTGCSSGSSITAHLNAASQPPGSPSSWSTAPGSGSAGPGGRQVSRLGQHAHTQTHKASRREHTQERQETPDTWGCPPSLLLAHVCPSHRPTATAEPTRHCAGL